MERREFIAKAGVITTAMAFPAPARLLNAADKKVKVILFDGFSIFNPAKVFQLALSLFPEKGDELVKEWRIKQFEYTWLRTLTGNYRDFIKVIEDALVYAAAKTGVRLDNAQRWKLVNAWYELDVWPEIPGVLKQLNEAGYRLGILSNFTPKMMMNVNVDAHGLTTLFEYLISVDAVKKYKPAPETYQMGLTTFNVAKQEVLFVPFAGWDAAGAKLFGYQTYWGNRMQTPAEELGVMVDYAAKDLNGLPDYLKKN